MITTFLDVLGSLLLVAAVAVLVGTWWGVIPALTTAGILTLAFSRFIFWRGGGRA